jgi:hypothetical protein
MHGLDLAQWRCPRVGAGETVARVRVRRQSAYALKGYLDGDDDDLKGPFPS